MQVIPLDFNRNDIKNNNNNNNFITSIARSDLLPF